MDSLNKRYYKISEVATLLNIPASTLRFWEKEFTIIKPRRNDRGTRFYTPDDIEKIRMVYYLVKEKGYKLDAAQEEIKRNHDGVSKRVEAINTLKEIRLRLQTLLDALNSRR
ncbi:MAG: MerR family transcriptional regulator [Muribaculaceae bacterium]|nr:MerR family transcriptional regulator [Muribaculaceae bacterium]MDE5968132.1 MerR family transcriptional regulator [Muribaculaceae bacterium]MDE7392871.1 MerR family transcriptional regulator [Muribaculaceae bacterium]